MDICPRPVQRKTSMYSTVSNIDYIQYNVKVNKTIRNINTIGHKGKQPCEIEYVKSRSSRFFISKWAQFEQMGNLLLCIS